MRRTRRTSRRYRGSRRGGIGVLIPMLLVLCVAAAISLYFINDNMAFTLDGVFFPVLGNSDPSEEIGANLIIEEPETEQEIPDAPPPQQQVQEPASAVTDGSVRALFVPIGSVKSAELFSAALAEISADAKINTLVLEVKAEDGTLAFSTDSPIAENAAVSGDDATLKSAMEKAREAGYKVALYMSCFKDNEAARKNQAYSARTANKVIWLDGNNVRWLSAYSDPAREYLVSAVGKLASFSPDEIILSNISFPAIGKTELLAYEEELGTKREMLKRFIDEAKKAAGSVALSAVYENYNEKLISESGQSAEDFAGFDTVYISSAGGRYTLGFDDAAPLFEGADCKTVPITADFTADEFMMKK